MQSGNFTIQFASRRKARVSQAPNGPRQRGSLASKTKPYGYSAKYDCVYGVTQLRLATASEVLAYQVLARNITFEIDVPIQGQETHRPFVDERGQGPVGQSPAAGSAAAHDEQPGADDSRN